MSCALLYLLFICISVLQAGGARRAALQWLRTYCIHICIITPHSKAGHITLHLPDWVDDCLYEVPDMTYMGLHHSIRGSKLFASRKSFIGGRKTKSGSKKEMNGVFCCRRRQDGLRLDVAWDKTIWFFFFSFREEGRPTRLGHIG